MDDLQQSVIDQLCAVCDLGAPLGVPSPVQGGLLHRMWRLTTAHGTFALKQLNPAIMSRPGIHAIYRLTERIATRFAEQGLPAVAALSPGNDPLVQSSSHFFLVYHWMNGQTLATHPVDHQQARIIGSLLAQMHTLDLHVPDTPPLAWDHFGDDDWDMLTFQAADQNLPWAYPVRAALPKLCAWSHAYEQAGETLGQTVVISHRDLDQKNVIWHDPSTPYLIDWEAAGPINPTMELAALALDWSRQPTGETSEDLFTAVIEGYLQAGGTIHDPGITALHGVRGRWLGWLFFNMHRSLMQYPFQPPHHEHREHNTPAPEPGGAATQSEEQQLAIRETSLTLTILLDIQIHLEKWAGWLDRCR